MNQVKRVGSYVVAHLVRCEVSPGPRESEATVAVKGVEETVHLRVPKDFLVNDRGPFHLTVGVVAYDAKSKRFLIELPHEADSGVNRLWVSLKDVVTVSSRKKFRFRGR